MFRADILILFIYRALEPLKHLLFFLLHSFMSFKLLLVSIVSVGWNHLRMVLQFLISACVQGAVEMTSVVEARFWELCIPELGLCL